MKALLSARILLCESSKPFVKFYNQKPMDQLDSLQNVLSTQTSPITLDTFVIHLLMAWVLAFALGWIYRRYGLALSDRDRFSRNFVLLTMTTMVIISFVRSSLALSLGLVGALSIIRFRAAIKEPEELMYLFVCIAIGLGLGAGQRFATLISFALIGIMLISRGMMMQKKENANLLLRLSAPASAGINLESIIEILDQGATDIQLKRLDENERQFESVFLLNIPNMESLSSVKEKLHGLSSELHVSLVDQKIVD